MVDTNDGLLEYIPLLMGQMNDAEDVTIASHFVPSLEKQLPLKKAPANEIGRLTDRLTDRQTDRQADRQAGNQTS